MQTLKVENLLAVVKNQHADAKLLRDRKIQHVGAKSQFVDASQRLKGVSLDVTRLHPKSVVVCYRRCSHPWVDAIVAATRDRKMTQRAAANQPETVAMLPLRQSAVDCLRSYSLAAPATRAMHVTQVTKPASQPVAVKSQLADVSQPVA